MTGLSFRMTGRLVLLLHGPRKTIHLIVALRFDFEKYNFVKYPNRGPPSWDHWISFSSTGVGYRQADRP